MRKLLVLFSLLLVVNSQAQTKDQFKILLDKLDCKVIVDTTSFIIGEVECERLISGVKYRVDLYVTGILDRNTLTSWTESWTDATKQDVIQTLNDNEYLKRAGESNVWLGRFANKDFMCMPLFSYEREYWYILFVFI
jgi:hypothetical protein